MADLSTLPNILPWPFLACNRNGEILFANASVSSALKRRVEIGMNIDTLFEGLENGLPSSSLLHSSATWSAWNGILKLRVTERGEPAQSSRIIILPDPRLKQQVWIFFADAPQGHGLPILTQSSGMSLAQRLIQNSSDFIIFRDLQGRILHTSRSLDEFLGLPYQDFIPDLTLSDILSPATAAKFSQLDEDVIQSGQSVLHTIMEIENRYGRSCSTRIFHERIKDGGGLPNGLLTIASVIVNSADACSSAPSPIENAEEFTGAKWQLIANVTHEIRNPVNAILGLCETHLEQREPVSPEVLNKILVCSREIEETIRDVLDFARLEQGNIMLESTPFNPIRTLEEVTEQFQPQANRKGIELACLINPSSPQSVLGDPVKFRRIIANLINNAVKFTEKGHVYAELNFEQCAERLCIQVVVRDTGIGIPANKLESIFEPFTQADASTSRRFGGSGLGLSIVRSLTKAMDGHTNVTSEIGLGSTFTATVMFNPNPTFTSLPQPKLDGKRILLAAGSPIVRHWMAHCLTHWGAKCHHTENYEEAEASWKAATTAGMPFDRAILDLPDDINPRIPTIPREQVILITSPEVELTRQTQLLRPITLTGFRKLFEAATGGPLEHATEQPRRSRGARSSLRVLLAEDCDINREVANLRLRRAGHEVSATVDGSSALDLWQTKEFDIAILDIEMPIMNGLNVATAIRTKERERGCRRIPLLAVTGMTQEKMRSRCQAAGFDAYLTKPVQNQELLDKLKLLTAHHESALTQTQDDEFAANLESAEAEDAEDLRAAARAFIRHADDIIARLVAARNATAPDTLSREAHGVKGMLYLISCKGLAQLATQIEHKPSGNAAMNRTDELIDGLRNLRDRLRSRSDLSTDAQAETKT